MNGDRKITFTIDHGTLRYVEVTVSGSECYGSVTAARPVTIEGDKLLIDGGTNSQRRGQESTLPPNPANAGSLYVSGNFKSSYFVEGELFAGAQRGMGAPCPATASGNWFAFRDDWRAWQKTRLQRLRDAISAGDDRLALDMVDRIRDHKTVGILGEVPPLATAVDKGNVKIVRALLAAGANPDEFGGLALRPSVIRAAFNGQPEMVREMLNGGSRKTLLPEVLATACLGGRADVVALLLDSGLDVDAIIPYFGYIGWSANPFGWSQNGHKRTPLIIAIDAGREDVVRLLLVRGAHAGIPDGEGRAPIVHALKKGNPRILELVRRAGR